MNAAAHSAREVLMAPNALWPIGTRFVVFGYKSGGEVGEAKKCVKC